MQKFAAWQAVKADPRRIGGVAQLGERELCKLEVIGSIPFASTNTISFPDHIVW